MVTQDQLKSMNFIMDIRKIGKSILKEVSKNCNRKFEFKDHPIGCKLVSAPYVVLLTSDKAISSNNSWAINLMIQDSKRTLGTYKAFVSSNDNYTKDELKKAQQNVAVSIVDIIMID